MYLLINREAKQIYMLFAGFVGNDIDRIKSSRISILSILLLTALIGIMRHSFEIIGGCKFGYWWQFGSASNTTTFSYLLVLFAIPLVTIFFGQFESEGLRTSISLAIPFLFITFIMVPAFNSVFNYNFLMMPDRVYIPFIGTFLYVAVGSFVGFAYILYKGTVLFSKLFNKSYRSSFLRLLSAFLIIYIYTYYIGIAFTWGPRMRIYVMDNYPDRSMSWPDIQFYSSTFTITLLIFLPVLFLKLKLNKTEKISCSVFYLVVGVFHFIYLNNSFGIFPLLVF